MFELKVREKRAKLKESEAELARRHEATRRALEAQARELEDRQRALDADRANWERETGLSLDDLRRRSLEANSRESVPHFIYILSLNTALLIVNAALLVVSLRQWYNNNLIFDHIHKNIHSMLVKELRTNVSILLCLLNLTSHFKLCCTLSLNKYFKDWIVISSRNSI